MGNPDSIKFDPTGTRPIDKWGIGKEDIHDIKDGIRADPEGWFGVTPGRYVTTTGSDGRAVDPQGTVNDE